MDMTHQPQFKLKIYCDESSVDKKYKIFTMVYSLKPHDITEISNVINSFTAKKKLKEIKWNDICTAQRAEDIILLLEEIKPYFIENKVRILSGCVSLDNIRKDEHRSSNNGVINFLAYQMLIHIVKQIHFKSVLIKIMVDKGGPFDKNSMKSYLNYYLQSPDLKYNPVLYSIEELMALGLEEAAAYGSMYEENTKLRFILDDIYEQDSTTFPLIQIADLFAGMHSFSYNRLAPKPNRSFEAKQTILKYITNTYAGVYNSRGLKSPPYSNPNFWLFK